MLPGCGPLGGRSRNPTLLALARIFETSLDALLGVHDADAWLAEATELLKGVLPASRATVLAMLRGVLASVQVPPSPVYKKRTRTTSAALSEPHAPRKRV
jgi:hypothetical protein